MKRIIKKGLMVAVLVTLPFLLFGFTQTWLQTLTIDGTNDYVGINDSTPSYDLDVTGTTNITQGLIVDSDVLYVDVVNDRVGINDGSPSYALDVDGTFRVVGVITADDDLVVDTSVLFVDSSENMVGINDGSPSYALDITGTTNITEGLIVDSDVLYVDVANNRIGVNDGSPSYALDVDGTLRAVSVITADDDLVVDTNTLFVDASEDRVGINDATPSFALDVSGTTNITQGLIVDTDTLYVDVANDRVGISTANPSEELSVNGDILVENGGIDIGGGGIKLAFKIVEIGDFDLNVADGTTLNVAHGLGASFKNIRQMSLMIRDDTDAIYTDPSKVMADAVNSGVATVQYQPINVDFVDTTNVRLQRYILTGGVYDSTDDPYDSNAYDNASSYNRGWITIWYVP